MQEIIKENQIYEEQEYNKIFKIAIMLRYHNRTFITYYLYFAIILFAIGATFIANQMEKHNNVNSWGVAMVVSSIFFLYLHFTEKNRMIKRAVSFQLKISKPHTYIMNVEGLKDLSPSSEEFYKWDYYTHYVMDAGVMLLYENEFVFRMFSSKYYSNDEWKQLVEWINLKVKPKNFLSRQLNLHSE